MNEEEIVSDIYKACINLYNGKKRYLIDERSNECTISSHLAKYIEPFFVGWDVDPEYTREGILRTPKKDLDGIIIKPDIIIHKNGPDGPNLVAIEVKGYWNKQSRYDDEENLLNLQLKHQYKFLFRIELGKDAAEIIPVHY